MTRKIVYQNSDDAILTPRHAMVVDNEIYLPSMRMHMVGKTELKFAKIVSRNRNSLIGYFTANTSAYESL